VPSNDATAGAASARPAGSAASSNGANNRLYYPTGERDTSMLLLERTGPAQVRVGKPYDYQITVTNLTNTPLRGVTVQEMLPGFFAVSGDAAAAKTDAARTDAAKADADAAARDMAAHKEGGGAAMVQHTYVIGELGPKESRTINLRGTPSQAGQLNACTSVTCNPTLRTAALITNPQMRLTKESIGSATSARSRPSATPSPMPEPATSPTCESRTNFPRAWSPRAVPPAASPSRSERSRKDNPKPPT
jgi:uncharacterized repeat protein (TIGR01451 family)